MRAITFAISFVVLVFEHRCLQAESYRPHDEKTSIRWRISSLSRDASLGSIARCILVGNTRGKRRHRTL
jgi:hypothetical protein